MSESRNMLVDAATRLFADLRTRDVSAAAERGEWPAALWDAMEKAGLSTAARSEERGGAGATFGDVAALLRVAGAFAVPLPLAETILAEQMLAAAGLAPMQGALSVGPVIRSDRLALSHRGGGWSVAGALHRIPWGRDVTAVVAVASLEDKPVTVIIERPRIERQDRNYAHEPRDDLRCDDCSLPADAVGEPGCGWDADTLRFRGALVRCLQMTGALERILESTVAYAKERVAFGRPIGKFQAVQQQIARRTSSSLHAPSAIPSGSRIRASPAPASAKRTGAS